MHICLYRMIDIDTNKNQSTCIISGSSCDYWVSTSIHIISFLLLEIMFLLKIEKQIEIETEVKIIELRYVQ